MDFGGDIGFWQRRIAEGPEGAMRRLMTFDSLEISPGQSILEIGCGGGHLTREIALAVGPGGRAVGLDLTPEQIAAARTMCRDIPNAELVEGSVLDLPFAENTFDGAASINTLEYVAETQDALEQVRRVMKRGARAVIQSVLWDHWQYHGPDADLTRRMLDAWRGHCHHQMLPLTLPSSLARAGFGGIRREAFTFMNGSLHENTYAYWAAKVVATFAAKQGVPEEATRDWLDQLEAADREGRFGFVNVSVLTTATAH